MPKFNLKCCRWMAAMAVALAFATPGVARAQVVVITNGLPITEYDIQQRSKLMASSSHKVPTRQEVINELIDDRLKISRAKYYGYELPNDEVETAFNGMAARQHITPEQFTQFLERAGISPNTVKARIRAELTWQQLIRGKYNSSLQVGDSDIANALKDRKENDSAVGYVYTLYPVTIVIPRGSGDGVIAAKRSEAENLRGRFTSCNEGLTLARSLRDVAVREPINRSSADLTPDLRELLGKMEVGRLTTPEVTPQGLQMFAVCNKKESTSESPLKRETREQIFTKRFESESKKYLDEIRKSAMIEYKTEKNK